MVSVCAVLSCAGCGLPFWRPALVSKEIVNIENINSRIRLIVIALLVTTLTKRGVKPGDFISFKIYW
jgi:hypothetical protein